MSRLDPSRELQDFLEAIDARGEASRDSESKHPGRQPVPATSLDKPDPGETRVERQNVDRDSQTSRGVLYDRGQGYRLSPTEIRSMAELGKFRVIAANDLEKHLYSKDHAVFEKDIDDLARRGLVRKGSFEGPEGSPRVLLTLTKRGHRLLRANQLVPPDQATYSGFVKPREANHDADLYRLYQKEAARIEQKGGRVRRVVLDFEIKRKVNRDLAKLGPQARPEIAARYGLQVVRNKIPIPDLQIEYETRDGDAARVNLELVTEHYRGRSVAEKARAGFSLYTPRGEGDKLRRVLDQQELTAEILSL